jgi:fatty-acyl-CoA synthase
MISFDEVFAGRRRTISFNLHVFRSTRKGAWLPGSFTLSTINYQPFQTRPMETPLTPLEFARRARKLYPDRVAVIDGDSRWTYAQFLDRCDRWSAVLQKLGIGSRDRVAYLSPNTHAQLESFYAVPQVGAVLVPLNYRLTADDFIYLINHSGSRMVCADGDYLGAIDNIREHLPKVEHFVALSCSVGCPQPNSAWLDYQAMVDASSAGFARPEIRETDLLTINYTSGTTAHPKGVMITHRNAWMNSIGTLLHAPMTCADRYLWTLPMFHANGWTFVWTVTAAGATHVCLRKVEPRAVFELMATEQVTMLCAAPTVLIALANAPGNLRRLAPKGIRVLTAGAPPAASTIQRLEEELGWTITHVYGLTETAPFITVCEPRAEHASLPISERAAIKARQGVELITSGELRVVDTKGNDVPHDGVTQGEIVARGNVVMAGYYNDAEATEQALRGGWFHTGDAAVVHPDGYVEIRDRLKDVIISGGENISSVEVEGVLLRHPAVQEVAIVGFAHERWGEAPHAFVVLKQGARTDERELREFARANLAHFKAPHSVTFVKELPKTATGKIQKYILRAQRPAIAPQ